MGTPKAKKSKSASNGATQNSLPSAEAISTNAELKAFLQSLLDRMEEGQLAAIFTFSAINHLISSQATCELFCSETKEMARDLWLRVKQSGLQIRSPVFLFGSDAEVTL